MVPSLHVTACGDFTLMSRHSWAELAGYAEWPYHSWNLDSLLLYQASAAGFRFVELESPTFHMEHAAGWSPEFDAELFDLMAKRGIPVLSDPGLVRMARGFRRRADTPPWRLNKAAEWGLASARLESSRLRPAGQSSSWQEF